MITYPNGDIVEDRLAATAGSYTATAPLFSSGTWVMQMVAFRAASGGGGPDTQAPTAPGNLSATVTAATQIDLAWTAATDNVAVTSYLVERCVGSSYCTDYVQIGTTTGTSFSNTGLAFGTRYRYRVRATDAAGNLGPYSDQRQRRSPPSRTPRPPTAPSALEATAPPFTAGQINLAWTGSTDNVGVAVLPHRTLPSAPAAAASPRSPPPPASRYSDTGLAAGTSYSYRVRAADANGNTSGYSTRRPPPRRPLTPRPRRAPSGLTATLAPSGSQIELGVDRLHGQRRGDRLPRRALRGRRLRHLRRDRHCPGPRSPARGLVAGTSYSYRVRARTPPPTPAATPNGGRHHPGRGGGAGVRAGELRGPADAADDAWPSRSPARSSRAT